MAKYSIMLIYAHIRCQYFVPTVAGCRIPRKFSRSLARPSVIAPNILLNRPRSGSWCLIFYPIHTPTWRWIRCWFYFQSLNMFDECKKGENVIHSCWTSYRWMSGKPTKVSERESYSNASVASICIKSSPSSYVLSPQQSSLCLCSVYLCTLVWLSLPFKRPPKAPCSFQQFSKPTDLLLFLARNSHENDSAAHYAAQRDAQIVATSTLRYPD